MVENRLFSSIPTRYLSGARSTTQSDNTSAYDHFTINAFMNESAKPQAERSIKRSENDAPVRFLRREWKHNKPYLQRSASIPTLCLLPTTRPHFTCHHCGFVNTQIPMCLWCCWTSKEAESSFEKSMPRTRRVSAPMRLQWQIKPRHHNNKERESAHISDVCQNDRSALVRDRGGRKIDTKGGSVCSELAEPSTWGERPGSARGQIAHEVYHTSTWPNPRLQANNKRTSSLKDANGGVVSEVDLRQSESDSAGGRNMSEEADPIRNGELVKPGLESMLSVQAARPAATKSGMSTIGDVSASDKNSVESASYAKERSRLPLRLRRLKGAIQPLHIDSTISSLTSVSNPASPRASHDTKSATSATSPTKSPHTLRRKSHLKIFRSFSSQDNSPDYAGSQVRLMTNTEPSQINGQRPNSDPFGEVLWPKNMASASTLYMPDSSSFTLSKPDAVGLNETSPHLFTPATPTFSIRSGSSYFHPRPLYAAIRKNGVCLSPPLPLGTSATTSPKSPGGKVNEYDACGASGYGSPASSVFPLYTGGDTMLLSLSLESRSSSSSTLASAFAEDGHISGPLTMLKAKCGYRPKSRSKSRPRSKRGRDKDNMLKSTASGRNTPSITGMAGLGRTESGQRVFQVPVGPGTGCSMSGETELKLALARHDKRASTPERASPAAEQRQTTASARRPGSPSLIPGKVIRRLKEMVSRTF
ncbi:hypothetical protein APHAL10511_000807 [Amanita phalloides]|nr:hypothetical protein APHAL10511_000807 [Amanita phalloides]